MRDVKLRRMLPTVRRYALDRVPTLEDLREIVDAADIRGKALTLVLVSSGRQVFSIAERAQYNAKQHRKGYAHLRCLRTST
jgi:hypothetical protein